MAALAEQPTFELPQDITAEDAAWARISTPFGADKLRAFLADPQRLLRINPLLEFQEWSQPGPGRYHMTIRNLSNGKDLATDISIEESPEGIRLIYAEGLKACTLLRVEPNGETADLLLVDDYGRLSEEERRARLDEVDKSLEAWARGIREYLVGMRRWSWFPPWRWYMRRLWQPMKPSARRISSMLIWITALEFVAFLAVVAIFVARSV